MSYQTSTDRYPLTEAGDAEHFAAFCGDRIRFDHRQQRWLIFGKNRWLMDRENQRFGLALESMRRRQTAALAIDDSDRRQKHLGWAMAGESRRRLGNMLDLARTMDPVKDAGDNWDTNPWLLGVENGVVDLRTGDLYEGRPEDRITMAVRAPYDLSATCPRWTQMITQVFCGDEDLTGFIQRALGYSLTGDTREQCLFMNWGDGANGKSTLINAVSYVLGDYAEDLPFSTLELEQRGGISNDVAKLVQKRFVTSSETNDGMRLNEARVKALTGCDPITARFLYGEFFTFQPVAKFWLATNYKPVVRDNSHGFWRRMRLVPFTARFDGTRDNKMLKEELKAEAAGILAWLVVGCVEWQMRGLRVPKAVSEATADYETESNPLIDFIDDECIVNADSRVGAKELFNAYKAWATRSHQTPLNHKRFGQQIKRDFRSEERSHKVTYIGIGLRPERVSSESSDPSGPFSAEASHEDDTGGSSPKKGPNGSNLSA